MNKMFFRISVALFLFISCNNVSEYYCEGYVKDVNGDPIALARIDVAADLSGKEVFSAKTDVNGYYKIKLPSPLEKMIVMSMASGYETVLKNHPYAPHFMVDTAIKQETWRKNKGRVKMPDVTLQLRTSPRYVLVRGCVLDAETEKPIPGLMPIANALTNRLGYYYFLWTPPAGSQTLQLKLVREGYVKLNYDTTLVVEKGTILHLPDLKMKKK